MGRIALVGVSVVLAAWAGLGRADTCTPGNDCKHRVRQDHRNLMAGASIGVRIDRQCARTGTMGVFLRDGQKRTYLLSNTHVLACFDKRLHIGNATCVKEEGKKPKQEGQCVWHPNNDFVTRYVLGILAAYVPIGLVDKQGKAMVNTYDAAVARLVDGIRTNGRVIDLAGAPSAETAEPAVGSILCKSGATTGFTCGKVIAEREARPAQDVGKPVTTASQLQFSLATTVFLRALTATEAEKLPQGLPRQPTTLVSQGDSGSVFFVVLGDDGKLLARPQAAALLYAGNDKDRAFAHPINGVLGVLERELGIDAGTLKVVDGPPPKD